MRVESNFPPKFTLTTAHTNLESPKNNEEEWQDSGSQHYLLDM
jgi:hypothetical protein